MSIVTLKKKTLAQYQTQNNLNPTKKDISYCSGNYCRGVTDKTAYTNVNQTFTATNFFTILPKSSATPMVSTDLVTKAYVDSASNNAINNSVSSSVTLTGDQTITSGVKTFADLPVCTAFPTTSNQLVNKAYVDASSVSLSGNQTIRSGVKTFTDLPVCTTFPTTANQLVNKAYVDASSVTISGTQTILAGVKTFTDLPACVVFPTTANQLVNKAYVDASSITISGNQTLLSGVKTFTNLPVCSAAPTSASQLINKSYADGVLSVVYDLNVTSSNYDAANRTDFKNSTIRITSNGSYTITIPTPASLSGAIQIYQNINNSTEIKLSITSGIFTSKYGSNTTSIILPRNSWLKLYSDGTNYNAIERNADNQYYYINIASASLDILNNAQYLNSELHLVSSYTTANADSKLYYTDVTTTIMLASSNYAQGQYYLIYNDNHLISGNANSANVPANIRVSCTSLFKGIYQSNNNPVSTLIIPPNTWFKFYSDGNNWIISDTSQSGNQQTNIIRDLSDVTLTLTRPLQKNNYINNARTTSGDLILTLPLPLPSDVGVEYNIFRGFMSNSKSGTFRINPAATGTYYYLNGNSTNSIVVDASSTGYTTGCSNYIKALGVQTGFAGSGLFSIDNTSNILTVNSYYSGFITHGTIIKYGIGASDIFTVTGLNSDSGFGITVTGQAKFTVTPSATLLTAAVNKSGTWENVYAWYIK